MELSTFSEIVNKKLLCKFNENPESTKFIKINSTVEANSNLYLHNVIGEKILDLNLINMLENFNEFILEKIRKRNISTEDFSKSIGISRSGLYKLLDNPSSIKLSVFMELCSQLNIEINEALGIDNHTIHSNDIVDRTQLRYLSGVLNIHNYEESDLALFLKVSMKDLFSFVNSTTFGIMQLRSVCSFFKVPIDIFYKEQYKVDYKNIKAVDYINHNALIERSQRQVKFWSETLQIKLCLIDTINTIFPNKNNLTILDSEDIELIENFADISNFPIVFLTNYPNHINQIQHNIETVADNVYSNILVKNKLSLHDIIWVEISYFSERSLNVSLLKSESPNKFNNPKKYTIRGASDRNIKIDIEKIKAFLYSKRI